MSAPSIRINLLPEGTGRDRYGGKFLQWALTYGRYIIIFTELIVLIAFFSRFKFDQELSDLREIIKHKQAVVTSVADFELEVRNLQDRIAKIKSIDQNHDIYPEAIRNLDDLLPDDVVLSSLLIQDKSIKLSGVGYSTNGVKTFLATINTSPQYKNITLGSIGPPEDGLGALKFDLSMDIAVPEN